jgi:hypothetical protein
MNVQMRLGLVTDEDLAAAEAIEAEEATEAEA